MVNGEWWSRVGGDERQHSTPQPLNDYLPFTIHYSLAFPLVNVRQRLLGRGALRRPVGQHRDLLQRVDARARLHTYHVRRRGRALLYLYHGSDAQARWVDAVLPRGNHIVADVHGLEPRHVAHLKEPVLAEAAHGAYRVRLAQLPDDRARGRTLVRQ